MTAPDDGHGTAAALEYASYEGSTEAAAPYDDGPPAKPRKTAKSAGNGASMDDNTSNSFDDSKSEGVHAQAHLDSLRLLDPASSPDGLFTNGNKQAARKAAKEIRAQREREILSQLTEHQQAIIEQALEIVRHTESKWLVMVFKRIASVRSRELFAQLGEPERFFEPAGDGGYWREAWRDPVGGRRLDEHASRKRLGTFITSLLKSFGM